MEEWNGLNERYKIVNGMKVNIELYERILISSVTSGLELWSMKVRERLGKFVKDEIPDKYGKCKLDRIRNEK